MKKQDVVFFSVIVLIVLIFNSNYIYNAVTDKFQKFSSVENRAYNTFSDFKFKDFFVGNLQSNFESSMSDQAIYAEKIRMNYNETVRLLDYKNINRNLCENKYVRLNRKVGIFDCSEYLVYRFNPSYIEELKSTYEHNFKFWNDLNNKFDTYFYYINGSTDYDFEKQENITNIRNEFKHYLDNSFKLKEFEIEDYDNYKNLFYKTDCHWNQNASYKAYTELVDFLTDEVPLEISKTYTFEGTNFYGYNARELKYFDIKEAFSYHYVDIDNYDSYIDGKLGEINSIKHYLNGYYSKDEYVYHYAYLNGDNYAERMLDFHNESKDNILILADSFSNALIPLIANHFNKTYVLDHRYVEKNINLSGYIKKNNIDKVLVIATNFFFEDKVESLEVK